MAATVFELLIIISPLLIVSTNVGQDGTRQDGPILEEMLSQSSISDFTVSKSLGYYRSVSARFFSVRVTDVESPEAGDVLMFDNETVSLATSDLTIVVEADWTVALRTFFFTTRDNGIIRYRLHPISLTAVYGIDTDFHLNSCHANVEVSEIVIDSAKGYSWFYETLVSEYEDDLAWGVTREICDILEPGENERVDRKLLSIIESFN